MKVLLARTVTEGLYLVASDGRLTDARVATPRNQRSFEGARVVELYVDGRALDMPGGHDVLDMLVCSLIKTPNSKPEVYL